jgi:hypothetical protein
MYKISDINLLNTLFGNEIEYIENYKTPLDR